MDRQDAIVIDTETTSLHIHNHALPFAVGIKRCDGRKRWLWEWKVNPYKRLGVYGTPDVEIPSADRREIKAVLRDHGVHIYHHSLFDVQILQNADIDADRYWARVRDTLPISHAFDSRMSHGLKDMALQFLGISIADEKELKAAITQAIALMSKDLRKLLSEEDPCYWAPAYMFPQRDRRHSACRRYLNVDLDRTDGIFWGFMGIEDDRPYDSILLREHALLPVVERMEKRGLYIDKRLLATALRDHQNVCQEAAAAIRKVACSRGLYDFEVTPDQMRVLLFEKLRLDPVDYTPTGKPALDKDIVKHLCLHTDENTTAGQVVRTYQVFSVNKTASQYLQVYDKCASPPEKSGSKQVVIRSKINPSGTGTTRFTGEDPNPMQVGKGEKDKEGRWIKPSMRRVFVPREGYHWYSFDYSQLELRIFAKMAGEDELYAALCRGEDGHQWTADQFTLTRKEGKFINFGFIYGEGEGALIAKTGCLDIKEQLRVRMPAASGWMQDCIRQARREGYIWTVGGYRLKTDPARPYAAANYKVQGSAGDFLKESMLLVDLYFRDFGLDAYMFACIHDELDVAISRAYSQAKIEAIVSDVAWLMRQPGQFRDYYTPVDPACIHGNWANVKEFKRLNTDKFAERRLGGWLSNVVEQSPWLSLGGMTRVRVS